MLAGIFGELALKAFANLRILAGIGFPPLR
jgi:hypothetical protein